jgi:hypothetical protein
MRSIKLDGETYDIPTQQAQVISKTIAEMWERLGRPETPLSESGEKLMKIIIATWEDTFPIESNDWYEARKEYKLNEFDIKTQVHRQTGRSLASYPSYIYNVMKRVFPQFKLSDRENVMKLVKKYPIFQMANKV